MRSSFGRCSCICSSCYVFFNPHLTLGLCRRKPGVLFWCNKFCVREVERGTHSLMWLVDRRCFWVGANFPYMASKCPRRMVTKFLSACLVCVAVKLCTVIYKESSINMRARVEPSARLLFRGKTSCKLSGRNYMYIRQGQKDTCTLILVRHRHCFKIGEHKGISRYPQAGI